MQVGGDERIAPPCSRLQDHLRAVQSPFRRAGSAQALEGGELSRHPARALPARRRARSPQLIYYLEGTSRPPASARSIPFP